MKTLLILLLLLGAAFCPAQTPVPALPAPPATPAAPKPGPPGFFAAPRLKTNDAAALPGKVDPAAAIPAVPPAPGTPAALAPGGGAKTPPGIVAPASTNVAEVVAAHDPNDDLLPPGTIRFQEADLSQVLDIYAELLGRTIIRPQTLPQPKITIRAQTPLTRREGLQALDTVLAMNGISTVLQGDKFVKVIPFSQAPTEGSKFSVIPADQMEEVSRYTTRVVQLKYSDPSEVLQVLQPFAKLPNSIIAIKSSQMLVIRDYMENVKRMMEMIELVDVAVTNHFEPMVIPIKYALAGDVSQVLSSLTSGGGSSLSIGASSRGGLGGGGLGGGSGSGFGTGAGGINRTGGIPGQPGYSPNAGGLGAAGGGVGSTRSAFQNRLAGIVNRASTGGSGGGNMDIIGPVKIIADERTNSLLIFAGDPNDMTMISNIIAKIDVVLAQVQIDSIIMEVSLSGDLNYGVTASQNQQTIGKFTGAGVMNNGQAFQNPKGLDSLNAFTNAAAGFSYFGKFGGNFDVAVKAAANDSRINVLSTPSILTSHAKQAEIFVGETRPYVTGTYFNGFTGGGSQSQYQQTQIGIRLSVLPLINNEGLVVMDIKQSIQQVGENVKIDNNLVPTTVDREASAYIAVHDRDTVMLGGFISSNKRTSNGGVPLLKDIPFLGNLFRSTSESKGRVELVVMMRPTVMQTPEIAALASAESIDKKLPGIKRAIRDNEKMELLEQKKNQNDKESIKP